MRLNIVLLGKEHDRESFDCGEETLNVFLRQHARKQAERFVGRTFVATSASNPQCIVGYYTLSAAAVDASVVPDKCGLSSIPVALLGRLAVDKRYQKQGIGEMLLVNALARAHRIAREELGAYAVVVDALHEKARDFYLHYGFEPLRDGPLHLFITMRKIEKLGLITTH